MSAVGCVLTNQPCLPSVSQSLLSFHSFSAQDFSFSSSIRKNQEKSISQFIKLLNASFHFSVPLHFSKFLKLLKKMSQSHCFSNLAVLFILIITQTKFHSSFCPRPLISFLRRYLRDVKFQNVDFHYFPTKLSLQRQKKIYRFDKLVDLRVCTMCSQSELPQIHPIQSQTLRSGFIAVHFLIFFNIEYS